MNNNDLVSIVMRSRNDRETIEQTLESVKAQKYLNFELLNFDSQSSDGTLEIIKKYNKPENIFTNDPENYVPGKVLNHAVAKCSGKYIVFLNSDATPINPYWLYSMVDPLANANIGATFGRQSPRKDCRALFAKDTHRAFGDGSIAANWVHFFSMANSACRKEIFDTFKFDETLKYSEDIQWSLRLKKAGFEIQYASNAIVRHSHNYTLKESFRRHYGEGYAERLIFNSEEISSNPIRYWMLPMIKEIMTDMYLGFDKGSLDACLHSIPLRFCQKYGRWRGYSRASRNAVAYA